MTTLNGVTPYLSEFAERYRALGYWEDRTLGQWFDETCARFSERVALVAHAEQITYRQLAESASCVNSTLRLAPFENAKA